MRRSKWPVSIKSLAESLNLSPGTVSIVLNGQGKKMRISEATQSRVLEAAQQLGYQPNVYAKRLREGKDEKQPMMVEVFTPYIKNVENVLGRFVYGLQTAITDRNLPVELLIRSYQYKKLSDEKEFFSSSYCNGAIVYGPSDEDMQFLQEETFGIPLILFNRPSEKYGSIYVEDYEAGRHAAQLLSAVGCKTAGLVISIDRSKAGNMRQLGFIDGCHQYGVTIAPNHIQESPLSAEHGYLATRNILESGSYPDGIFVQISEMAAGAVRAIHEQALAIPEDIKLISYGDSELEEYMTPSLTAIHMPVETMAVDSLNLIHHMISTNDWRPISQIEPLPFIYRESCPAPVPPKD